jgi:hypothetical protein
LTVEASILMALTTFWMKRLLPKLTMALLRYPRPWWGRPHSVTSLCQPATC